MCEVKPGPRCASDTCLAAAEAAQSYTDAYPGGPNIDSLAGSEPIGMLHARVQVAGRRWRQAHEALGAELSRENPDPDRVAQLKDEGRRQLTEYQLAQEVLKGTWARRETRDQQDEVIREHMEAAKPTEPVETFDADGYSTTTGLNKDGLDRTGHDGNGFKTTVETDSDGKPVQVVRHRDTGTEFSPDGYNRGGVNQRGIDRRGFDVRTGLHSQTGRKMGPDGRDIRSADRRGFDPLGYHVDTGTLANPSGFDMHGNKIAEAQHDAWEAELAAIGN